MKRKRKIPNIFRLCFTVALFFTMIAKEAYGLASCTTGQRYLIGSDSCTSCPSGQGSNGGQDTTCSNCNSGSYSTGSSGCQPCPEGRYTNSGGQSTCTQCSAGTYNSGTGNTGCITCEAGRTCAGLGTTASTRGTCGSGTYSDAGATSCTGCPPGAECPSTSNLPIRCRGGYYSDGNDASCLPCPAGSACPDGQSSPITCTSGYYSEAKSSECIQCPPGYECSSTSSKSLCTAGEYSLGRLTACKTCPAGYYCPRTDSSPIICPAGHYSAAGAIQCIICPAGSQCTKTAASSCGANTYSYAGDMTCRSCPGGHSCTASGGPTPCAAGYYSAYGSSTCTQCTAGNFCPAYAIAAIACPTGTYTESAGSVTCKICPAGYSCSNKAVAPVACTNGATNAQYSLELNGGSCTNCPAGYECENTHSPPSPCMPGFYSQGSRKECIQCPAGKQCPDTVSAPINCGTGEYSMAGWTSCMKCPMGYVCASKSALPVLISETQYTGLAATTTQSCDVSSGKARTAGGICADCKTGYTAIGGNNIRCVPCPAGYECAKDAAPSICPAGKSAFYLHQTCRSNLAGTHNMFAQRDTLQNCPHGTYNPVGSSNIMCVPCPAGKSCLGKGQAADCVDGEYSLEGEIHCHKCPPGFRCNTKQDKIECPAGQYWKTNTDTSCTSCELGYYCPGFNQDMTKCPPGTYQDNTGSTSCKVCDIGKYSAGLGAQACTDCPQGSYCPFADQPPITCPFGTYSPVRSTICLKCQDGYKCESGETSATPAGKTCSSGYICNPGRELKAKNYNVPCPAGFYASDPTKTSRLDACQECPQGSYCPAGSSSPTACLNGYYCPARTRYATEFPCPKGTFRTSPTAANSVSDCGACTQGSFCPGGTANPYPCPPGSYCPTGTGDPLQSQCPGGTFSGDTSGAALTATGECTPCTAGHYCPVGSIYPLPCPPGTVNPNPSKQYLTECVLPTAGKQATTWGNSNADGDPCTAGHYCPLGSFGAPFPCPAGTQYDGADATEVANCTQCTAGFACEEGTGAGVKEKLKCAAGHYCPLGTIDPYANPCPAGKYSANTNNQASGDCTPCPAGYYCLKGSTEPVHECPKGHYCLQGTQSAYQTPCPAGTYNHITKLKASTECFDCPSGHYCEKGSILPTVCPVGTYAPGTKYEAAHNTGSVKGCEACPAGQTCATAGTVTTTTCGVGYYSYSGDTTCLKCKAGHYCPDASTTGTNHDNTYICPAGYLCPEGLGVNPTSAGDTYKCAKGYYCPQGATAAIACLAGTYNDKLQGESITNCTQTPKGYYTKDASTTQGTLCTAGYYCEAGTTGEAAIPCPIGKYRGTAGAGEVGDCANCPAGYYCGQGTSVPTICPQGSFCLESTSTPSPCPIGTFGASVGLKAESECFDCLPGMFCSQKGLKAPDGLCDLGYYCKSKATSPNPTDGTTGNICPKGGFCDMGSFEPVSCKPGTFNKNTLATSEAECIACTPGKYCEGTFIQIETNDCTAGYYCEAGSAIPTAIASDKGYYSGTGASEQIECPVGKYNPLPAQSSCQNCLAGYYCNVKGLSENIPECPTGHYCPTSTETPVKCPLGTFNPFTKATRVEDCQDCLPGRYCSAIGLSAIVGLCDAGYYCQTKSQLQAPETDAGTYGPCPVGHYCPQGTSEPIKCPPGSYNPLTKQSLPASCTTCSEGKYCSDSGRSADGTVCDQGFFCIAGSTQPRPATGKCTAGYKCPAGSSVKIQCPAGTYQDQAEQGDCIQCPAGYFCAAQSTTYTSQPCPTGHYCPAGTLSANQYPCPAGTYNPQTKSQTVAACKQCKPGYYCATTGLTNPTGQCDAGYYCTSGSTTKTPPSGSNVKFNTCKAGNYCPQGAPYQIPCKPGFACPIDKLGDPSSYSCTQGYYCPEGSTSVTQVLCPQGHFCPAGSKVPTPCPRGTYSSATGLTASGSCVVCDAGSYCEKAALTAPTGSCAAGYFCKTAHDVERPVSEQCPPGYYCPVGSADKVKCTGTYQDLSRQSACKTCPAGYECPENGSTERVSKVMCDASADTKNSFYCPSSQTDKVSCGAGKYSVSMLSSTLLTDCQPCPPGFYCTDNAADNKFQSCPQGYICGSGSTSATGTAQCLEGFYCPAGVAAMIPCTPGKYCSGVGKSAETGDCSAGYYCKEKAISATPTDGTTGNQCPLGHYCPVRSSAPIACPISTYLDEKGKSAPGDCKACPTGKICNDLGLVSPTENCPQGYYCPIVSNVQMRLPCPPGYRCPAGVNDKINCLSGSYQYLSNRGSCEDCPARFYCSKTDTDNNEVLKKATICPAGKYCPKRTITAVDCPAGTFSAQLGLSLESECENCPFGYYCVGGKAAPDGPCLKGYYCIGKASQNNPTDSTTGNICPAGHYCPAGSYSPTKCPKGKIRDSTGGEEVANCTNCPAGYYCPYLGATTALIDLASNTHKCDAGYICLGGAIKPYGNDGTIAKQCSIGKKCNKGATAEIECLLGSYNPHTASGTCYPCPAGKACDETGLSAPKDCPVGHYCPLGTEGSDNKVQCPVGTFSNDVNLKEVSECAPCPPGKYCPIGTTDPSSNNCNAGSYCVKGSSEQGPTTNTHQIGTEINGLCPEGYYCEAGTVSPTPCPLGKYNPNTGGSSSSSCLACPAGKYCDELGIDSSKIVSKNCKQGYLCIGGSETPVPTDGTKGKICDPGKYCLEGTTAMQDCPGGSYEPRQGTFTATCQICPAGYSCAAGSTQPTPCPVKNYCPANATSPTLCPAGRYNDDQTNLEAADQCKECPTGFHCSDGEIKGRCAAGRFCDTGATSATDTNKPCPPGFYCPAYDSAECSALNHAACTACSNDACKQQNCCLWPIRCEANHIRLASGATQKSECTVCPNGYYCLAGANTQKICPRGFYCVPGATEKVTPCPAGTANNIEGKYQSTDCIACGVGYLCNKKGISDKNNFLCPLGYYCDNANTDDTNIKPCPAGTYRDTLGANAESQCHDCPAGYYCPEKTINPIPCRGGWYCPLKSSQETICTAGNYCHEKSPAETICPRAFYCPSNTDIYVKCREHYYCPQGAQDETLCPAGMIGWGNPDNYDIPSGCKDCDPGTYSELTDIGTCPTCPAGYVCLGGTTRKDPSDEANHKGYGCQAGYYCPAGSSAMTACPVGTFINTTHKSALTDCEQCPVNTFASEIGSSSCQSCGSSSRANQGASQCSCQGNNRKFTAKNKWCVCIDRFESATPSQSQVDSSEDCSSRLVATCPDTSDTEGNCVSTTNSCNSTCGTNGGTRVLGMCDCNAKTLTNAVCPESCRSSRNRMFLSATGDILVSSSDGSTNTTQSMSGLTNVEGSVRYSTTQDNRFVSVGLSGSTFTSNYEASSQLQGQCSTCNAARRRLSDDDERRSLASTGTINNPVVCISEGDILMFDVDSSTKSYPEYVTNSLLNTNTNFDYGDFLDLKTKIDAGSTVNYFMFQFSTSGIYVFQNSLDNSQQMMIAVVGSSQKCPDSSEYISPISMKSMLLVGAAESDVVYEPDWVFIICLMIGIMILIGFMIGVYYYLRRRWGTKMRRVVKYRKLNLKGEALPSIRADNRCFEYMMKNKDLRVTKRLRQTQEQEITYSKIKDIRIQLQNSLGRTKGEIFDDGPDGEYSKLINEKDNIMMQLDKLRDLVMDHKDNINGTLNVDDNSDDESGDVLMKNGNTNFKTLHDNLLASNKMDHDLIGEGNKLDDDELNKMMLIIQKKRENIDKDMDDEYKAEADEIQRKLANLDPDGDDDMRKKLMDELNAKLDRIDNSLKSEEDAQMAALQGKLAQRKKRRGKIVDDYVKLQQEKQELNDNSYIRKQIDKEIEKKYDDMEDEIEREREEGLRIIKENNDRMGDFEDKLRKNAGDKKNFDKHLEEYNNNRNKMQDAMRKEMLDQQKQLEDELRRRRDARAAKIEVERGKLISDAKEGVQDKLRDIEEKERAFEGLKANELDPFLKDIVKKSEQKVGNRRELDMIRAEADKALAKYRDAEDKERERIRQELLEKYKDQDDEEDEEIMTLRQQLLKEILDKEEEKESQLARIKREVEETPSAEDKQRLISDHNNYKNEVEEELKKMAEDGANRLEQRIRDRRARRKKEEEELLKERMAQIEEDKQNDEDKQHKEVEDVRDDLEERTIEEIVRGLQAAIPKEEVPSALEKIMDDRQMKELMELLVKQYEEKAQAMKDAVMKIMKEKSDEIEALNKEVAESKSFVREAYEKGGITEETMNDELKKIKNRYDERLSDINSKYGNKELEAEQKIVRDFAEKHTNEQIALEEKHMRERERFFSKLLPESAMKRILHGMISVEDDKLNDFIKEKYEERDARLRELEEKMAQFRLEMSDTQKELDDLDEYQRKLREKELLAQRNFDRQQQKILEQKRREQEAELTKVKSKEQREEMVKKHLEELNDLNRILGVERKRQIDIHRQMFEDKRAAIEKKRQELLEKRAEQERLRKLKEEEEEKNKKEMTELEKKRQERYLKLINENNRNMKLIDEYAYSTPIDWADRKKVKRDGKTPMSDAMNLGKGTKMTKEERLMKKIERIHNASKGPLTLELLARIMRLEEQATEMQDF